MEISNAVLAYHKANRYDKIFAKKKICLVKSYMFIMLSL